MKALTIALVIALALAIASAIVSLMMAYLTSMFIAPSNLYNLSFLFSLSFGSDVVDAIQVNFSRRL